MVLQDETRTEEQNGRICFRTAIYLAAPHTWVASTMPVFLAAVLSLVRGKSSDILMLVCTLAVCILMQSAVNTLNDYSDFVKGADTKENSPDPADAVLVHDLPKPKRVLRLGIIFLLVAVVPGIPVFCRAGWIPLTIGLAGGAVVLLYSFGKKPISYLPLGELVSGFVMGGLIPLAVYDVLTGGLDMSVLLFALPIMLGIAMIMFTNNGCDMAKDETAGRKTFPILLGKKATVSVYRGLLVLWTVLPETLLPYGGGRGMLIYPLLLIPALPIVAEQARTTFSMESRNGAMHGILTLNLILGLDYMLTLLIGSLAVSL